MANKHFSFDLSGDNLIINVSETQFNEEENPSLKWPQLLLQPNFKGSQVEITFLDAASNEITIKATVVNLSKSNTDETVLVLENIQHEHETAPDQILVTYSNIINVILLENGEDKNLSKTKESISVMDFSNASSDICFPCGQVPTCSSPKFTTPFPDEEESCQIEIPFLQSGQIDFMYLKEIHKLENSGLIFDKWAENIGLKRAIRLNGYEYGFPYYLKKYCKNEPEISSHIPSVQDVWENTFRNHKLPFDTWYPLEGYRLNKVRHDLIDKEQASNRSHPRFTSSPIPDEDQNPAWALDIPDIVYKMVDTQTGLHRHFNDHLRMIHLPYCLTQCQYDVLPQNWVEQNLTFTKNDFMENGKYAWVYVPSYLYVPNLFIQMLKIDPPSELALHLIWLRLRHVLNEANAYTDLHSSANYILDAKSHMTPWHIYTSKYFKAVNPANIIDHIQHVAAWKFYDDHKFEFVFSKKDMYDLFIRPVERICSIDSHNTVDLMASVTNMFYRHKLFDSIMTIVGLTEIKDKCFSAHYLLHKLSKIRHLSHYDLSNKKPSDTGPIALIQPLPAFDPAKDEPEFDKNELAQIRLSLFKKINSDEDPIFHNKPDYPPPAKLLDPIGYGGREINFSQQLQVMEVFSELLRAQKRSQTPFYFNSRVLTPDEEDQDYERDRLESFLRNDSDLSTSSGSIEIIGLTQESLSVHDQINKIKNLSLLLSEPLLDKYAQLVQPNEARQKAEEQGRQARSVAETPLTALTGPTPMPRTRTKSVHNCSLSNEKQLEIQFSSEYPCASTRKLKTSKSFSENLFSEMAYKNQPSSARDPTPSRVPYSQALQPRIITKNTFDQIYSAFPDQTYHQGKFRGEQHQQQHQQSKSKQKGKNQKHQVQQLAQQPPPSIKPQFQQPPPPIPYPPRFPKHKTMSDFAPHFKTSNSPTSSSSPTTTTTTKTTTTKTTDQTKPIQPNLTNPKFPIKTERHKNVAQPDVSDTPPYGDLSLETMQKMQQPHVPQPGDPNISLHKTSPQPPISPQLIWAMKACPRGKINSTILPWVMSKRQDDRDISRRIAAEVPTSALDQVFLMPCLNKEPFSTVFWTTSNVYTNTPRWATIPHCARSFAEATHPCPMNSKTHPNRFHDGIDLCIFPMDDDTYTRNISLSAMKKGNDWFLQIKEDLQNPDGVWEESFIYVAWSLVEKLVMKIGEITDIPLPISTQMMNVNPGTYTTRKMEDSQRKIFYHIDVVHETAGPGWIRMVHISQETPNPNSVIIGDISFPWVLADSFYDRIYRFQSKTE